MIGDLAQVLGISDVEGVGRGQPSVSHQATWFPSRGGQNATRLRNANTFYQKSRPSQFPGHYCPESGRPSNSQHSYQNSPRNQGVSSTFGVH